MNVQYEKSYESPEAKLILGLISTPTYRGKYSSCMIR